MSIIRWAIVRLVVVVCVLGVVACGTGEGPPGEAPDAVVQEREGLMETRQLAALTEMMDAVNAGDAKRYARLYAEEAVITIHGTGALSGRDAIEQHEVELLRQFPGTRLAFYTVWHAGPMAVVHYAVNGTAPGGRAMGHEGLLFYRFQPSGLIDEERRYMDSLTPMAQMGLLGPGPARSMPALPAGLESRTANGSPAESENVATVKGVFAALDSRNEAAFLSSVTEAAVLDEMIDPQPFVGRTRVKSWFESWTRAVPDARTEITNILGVGDFVLLEGVVRGTLNGTLGRLSPSGKKFAVHRAAMIQVTDGRLTRMSMFMNGKELAEAVGQWPPSRSRDDHR